MVERRSLFHYTNILYDINYDDSSLSLSCQGELRCYGEAEEARADHRELAQHLRGEAGRADQARWVLEEEGTVSWRLGISPFLPFCRYILEVAAVLRDQYGGDIPDTVEGLCKLKGVGLVIKKTLIFAIALPGGAKDGALVHECCMGQADRHWSGCPCAQVARKIIHLPDTESGSVDDSAGQRIARSLSRPGRHWRLGFHKTGGKNLFLEKKYFELEVLS